MRFNTFLALHIDMYLLLLSLKLPVKKNATICKICVPLFDKNMCHTFMVCSGFVREAPDMELQRFLPNAPRFLPNALQFGERGVFSQQKAPQSTDCGALQDNALRCGHQSVAHTVGEKRHTWHHIFMCCCGAFVAFFLMYTICTRLSIIVAPFPFKPCKHAVPYHTSMGVPTVLCAWKSIALLCLHQSRKHAVVAAVPC